MDNFGLMLLGMSCITFACRFLFFCKKRPFELGEKTKLALSYTAPSVLTAMWVPIVFLSYQHIEQSFFESPFLIAGLLSIILSLKLKSTLLIVVISIMVFITLQLLY
ncbi:AzlD domain-containing protein [uncultured Psychromonas sp.]|uniref:AzlD domain-containing protein n=1 Tax=uncultured Psychromonas sp. TaxID=173974 RepID=UPI002632E154|nr:AzlD domain-containing protein [uncultured Psychromonas sp.]